MTRQRREDKRREEYTVQEGFGVFYKAYPKKQNSPQALKAWKKLQPSKALLSEILKSIEAFKLTPQWRGDNGQFIPLPATFLNGRRWEDEPTIATGEAVSASDRYRKKLKGAPSA